MDFCLLVIPFHIARSDDVNQPIPQCRTSESRCLSDSFPTLWLGRGQMMGLLWSTVSAFFSLPLLKVWMELSKALRPPPTPSEEDRGGGGGGRQEESSIGGGGGGGGGGAPG